MFTQAPPNVMTPAAATAVDATLTGAVYPSHSLTTAPQWNRKPPSQPSTTTVVRFDQLPPSLGAFMTFFNVLSF
jgi:hypothetical protein